MDRFLHYILYGHSPVADYGLEDEGSIPGRGTDLFLRYTSRPALGPTQSPMQWVFGSLSSGVKWPER